MAREFVTNVDLRGNRLLNAVLTLENVAAASAPFPVSGRIIYDNGVVKYHNGSSWTTLGSGSGTGDVPSTRTITSGAGLIGGGDLSANRTLDIGQGTGILVGADAIQIDQPWLSNAIAGQLNVLGPILQINSSGQVNAVESPAGTVTISLSTLIPLVGTVIPAAVADAGALGVITNKFAREDHAHAGVSLTGAQTITGIKAFSVSPSVPTPTSQSDAASKGYVDLISQGMDFKNSVKVATTTAIPLSGLQTIDDVSLAAGDRVLVKDQVSAQQNGLWVAAAGGWTRAQDADASGEISDGTLVPIESGTSSADNLWLCTATTAAPWIPGSSGSTWTRFSSGGSSVSAGAGLTQTGSVFDVGAGNGIIVTADQVAVGPGDGTVVVDSGGVKVASAPKWTTARTLSWTGDVTGTSTGIDGTGNVSTALAIAAGVIVDADISPTAAIATSKISGLDGALTGKVPTSRQVIAGNGLTGGGALSADVTVDVVGDANLSVTANQVAVLSAPKWTTARTITLTGDATGTATLDGSANVSLATTVTGGAGGGLTEAAADALFLKPSEILAGANISVSTSAGAVTITGTGGGGSGTEVDEVYVGDSAPVAPFDGQMWVNLHGAGGPAGSGSSLPADGTTGQVLGKASDDDYDVEWIDPPAGSGGGGTVEGLAYAANLAAGMTPTVTHSLGTTDVSVTVYRLSDGMEVLVPNTRVSNNAVMLDSAVDLAGHRIVIFAYGGLGPAPAGALVMSEAVAVDASAPLEGSPPTTEAVSTTPMTVTTTPTVVLT